jgi:RNA polymerase sigma-70 factor (ECF subfamily)
MATMQELALLESARGGDQGAFQPLVEPYRSELHAHCYRMLGSIHDAEDALQETLLRAWRGLDRFEGRSSLRSWLYRIATNTSLNLIERRPKRVLPIDYGPAAEPHELPGRPVVESVWVEPYPAESLEDGYAAPDARYELRESVELAFVASLQLLPANQRAALILREVLGFSAAEVAETLDTSVASVNSALQRARKTVDERLPEESQQATLRALGDEQLSEIVDQFMAAMDTGDVDAVVGLLAEDAAWTMPPLATWYAGREAIDEFLRVGPLSGRWEWRRVAAAANGQPAVAAYTWHEDQQCFLPFALDVFAMRGGKIAGVTSFITRSGDVADPDRVARYPDEPPDAGMVESTFTRFGLATRLER